MPIPTRCPECGKTYRVPDKYAGRRLNCKQCAAVMSVGPGAAGSLPPVPKAGSPATPRASRASSASRAAATGRQPSARPQRRGGIRPIRQSEVKRVSKSDRRRIAIGIFAVALLITGPLLYQRYGPNADRWEQDQIVAQEQANPDRTTAAEMMAKYGPPSVPSPSSAEAAVEQAESELVDAQVPLAQRPLPGRRNEAAAANTGVSGMLANSQSSSPSAPGPTGLGGSSASGGSSEPVRRPTEPVADGAAPTKKPPIVTDFPASILTAVPGRQSAGTAADYQNRLAELAAIRDAAGTQAREQFVDAIAAAAGRAGQGVQKEGNRPFWVPLVPAAEPAADPVDFRAWTPYRPHQVDGAANKIVVAGAGGPFAATGLKGFNNGQITVYDVRTAAPVGQLQTELSNGTVWLSPDGRTVVNEVTEPGRSILDLYDVPTGAAITRTELPNLSTSSVLAVTDELVVLAGTGAKGSPDDGNRFIVGVDVRTGQTRFRQPLAIADALTNSQPIAIDRSGRWLGRLDYSGGITLYDLADHGRVAMTKPLQQATAVGLAFSPDGRSLAVATVERSGAKSTTLIQFFDMADGEETARASIPGTLNTVGPPLYTYAGPHLQWFPDSRLLLVEGLLVVSPTLGRTVAAISEVAPNNTLANAFPRVPLDGAIATPVGGSSRAGLAILEVPTDPLGELIGRIADGSVDAPIRPEADVQLVVEVEKVLHGAPSAVGDAIDERLVTELETLGLPVVESGGSEPLLQVSYRESVGKPFAENRGTVFNPMPTGKTAASTTIDVTMEWLDRPGGSVLWRREIAYAPRTLVGLGSDFSPESIRAATIRRFLDGPLPAELPYFVTADARPSTRSAPSRSTATRRRRSRSPDAAEPQPITMLPHLIPLTGADR